MAFLIADDALDYYAKEKFFGKEIGKDFYEGKVTLPLITIFQKGNEEEKEFLTEIMKKNKISQLIVTNNNLYFGVIHIQSLIKEGIS